MSAPLPLPLPPVVAPPRLPPINPPKLPPLTLQDILALLHLPSIPHLQLPAGLPANSRSQAGSASLPTPQQNPERTFANTHSAFLLFLGEIVGVLVLSFIADTSDDVGKVIVALMVVIALIWLIYHSDLITQWGKTVGLGA